MHLFDGVYTFPLTLELDDRQLQFNPGAVETDQGLLLVDAGYPGSLDQFDAHLDDAGFAWADVWGVALTHQDADHAGGLADIVDRADPVVFAHECCAPFVDGREQPVTIDAADGRYPAARVDVELLEGVRFQTAAGAMAVVPTPGHAPGHVSYHFPEAEFLISGDALHAPEGYLDGPRGPIDEQSVIESIGTLIERDVRRTLCQHGGFVEHDVDRIASIDEEALDHEEAVE
jgi:glyoxylase-like metal-dependent hydrolase (beta-lactamase superfamily II)